MKLVEPGPGQDRGHMDTSTRAGKRSQDFQALWLEAYREHGSVSHACRAVGCSRQHVYNLRRDDEGFARGWEELREETIDRLERSAMVRAIEGWEEPIYYQGRQVGTKRIYDNRLSEFMLTALRPERYRIKDPVPARPPEEVARDIIDAVARMNAATGGGIAAA